MTSSPLTRPPGSPAAPSSDAAGAGCVRSLGGTILFALPMLVVFGLFSWWPILRSVVMSLQKTNLVDPPEWVGLDNFRAVLEDPLLPPSSATPPGSRCSRSSSATRCR